MSLVTPPRDWPGPDLPVEWATQHFPGFDWLVAGIVIAGEMALLILAVFLIVIVAQRRYRRDHPEGTEGK